MKVLHVSEDILPIGEFKTQASRVLLKLRTAQRPIVITQNGKPTAVLITPEEFDRLHERDRFLAAVREGLADSEAGRIADDRALTDELEAELGTVSRS
jgi:prevent-host-death family protein